MTAGNVGVVFVLRMDTDTAKVKAMPMAVKRRQFRADRDEHCRGSISSKRQRESVNTDSSGMREVSDSSGIVRVSYGSIVAYIN